MSQVKAADQRNQNNASGAMNFDTAGLSSAGICGIIRVCTKLKYQSSPIHMIPKITCSQRNTACQKI